MVDLAARRARWGVSLLFLTNAVVYASVVPRFPQFKVDLALSNTALGLAIAASPLGALAAGMFATRVVAGLGSARAGVSASVVMSLNLLCIGFAQTGWWLALGLFVAGFSDSIGDVANNMHGLRVQRRYGRSIINGFHGVWSVGAVAGGALGAVASGLTISTATQFVFTALFFSIVSLGCARLHLAEPARVHRTAGQHGRPERRPRIPGPTLRTLIVLGALAALAGVVEDSGASWGAVYLSGTFGAGPGVSGLVFVSMAVSMSVSRLVGDRFVNHYGERTVAAAGAALAVVAMSVALVLPTPTTTIIGFGLAGLGTGTLIPAAMHAGDDLTGLPHGAALTVVSLVSRVGFLLSPPVVGLIADTTSLRLGLAVVPLASLAALLCCRVLRDPTTASAHRH